MFNGRLHSPFGESLDNIPRKATREAAKGIGEQQVVRSPPKELDSPDLSEDQLEYDDLLTFEPEEDPEQFFRRLSLRPLTDLNVNRVKTLSALSKEEDANWDIDLSPIQLAGDGIKSEADRTFDQDRDDAFLITQNRSSRLAKKAVLPSGTRHWIDFDACLTWADNILKRGWFTSDDMEAIIFASDGNITFDDMYSNLLQTLEGTGIQCFEWIGGDSNSLWDNRSDVSTHELAESIEATLSRSTPLLGAEKFYLTKSHEVHRVGPVLRAKQGLHLAILTSDLAVEKVLFIITNVLSGVLKRRRITVKLIPLSRPDNPDTIKFTEAFKVFKNWSAVGRPIRGSHQSYALNVFRALDLSLEFYDVLVKSLAESHQSLLESQNLSHLVTKLVNAMDQLLLNHLAFVRRFSSRNVKFNEDPEEVFQVAATGMYEATRRFHPERGTRFTVYSMFWMKQAVTRWRHNAASAIRIPVHRQKDVADCEHAREQLEAKHGRTPSYRELAAELRWDEERVREILRVPRQRVNIDDFDEWQNEILNSTTDSRDPLHSENVRQIVFNALARLPGREANIIRMRFGIDRDSAMTLEEIAQIYGLTRERIRQIEAKALRRLKSPEFKHTLSALLDG